MPVLPGYFCTHRNLRKTIVWNKPGKRRAKATSTSPNLELYDDEDINAEHVTMDSEEDSEEECMIRCFSSSSRHHWKLHGGGIIDLLRQPPLTAPAPNPAEQEFSGSKVTIAMTLKVSLAPSYVVDPNPGLRLYIGDFLQLSGPRRLDECARAHGMGGDKTVGERSISRVSSAMLRTATFVWCKMCAGSERACGWQERTKDRAHAHAADQDIVWLDGDQMRLDQHVQSRDSATARFLDFREGSEKLSRAIRVNLRTKLKEIATECILRPRVVEEGKEEKRAKKRAVFVPMYLLDPAVIQVLTTTNFNRGRKLAVRVDESTSESLSESTSESPRIAYSDRHYCVTGSSGTHMHTRKSAPRVKVAPGTVPQLEEKHEERPEGWLWQLGKMGKLSQTEMDEWSNEGEEFRDRVQWFRAEAEMQRWQEQKEQKLVELLRTIRSFFKMQEIWTQLVNRHASDHPGHCAYARQKAAIYQRRGEEAQNLARIGGYGFLLEPTANVIEYLQKERVKENEYLLSRVPQTI
ncbi:hypothetical protein C8R45DRAFT_931231 [Mycena sanguinolenta]|nr:hypothetical protein C8R45DRAFT_931231 [Mycena sanguinolenta]